MASEDEDLGTRVVRLRAEVARAERTMRDLMGSVNRLRDEVREMADAAKLGAEASEQLQRLVLGDPDDDESVGLREWTRTVDKKLAAITRRDDDEEAVRRTRLGELAKWKRDVATKVAFAALGGLITVLGAVLGLDRWIQ